MARRLIAWFAQPISPIIAGTTADFLLEPAMRPGGALTGTFGGLFGTGPGAGMGLLISLMGVVTVAVALAAYFLPVIREAESLLPDHPVRPAKAAGEAPA